ncbi:hypothetical protein TL16_g07396 [Triparma laevis f. inornata]|uniref:Uncharacterized protein n=1 Tax=Triparma laevis f. inornata TaxID=1714386 RepID=A0A9W7AXP8_9STRA|nr:hypothetical protein TL16_g07396 [Triparma laevis f. inornata]
MFKPVATRCSIRVKAQKTSRKRGREDEEKEDGEEQNEGSAAENLTTSTTVSTAPAATDQFMHTPEFRRYFVEFVMGDTLMNLRLATKGWKAAADAFIDEGVKSSAMIVHDGEDINWGAANARKKMRKLVTRVVFLLNVMKVVERECKLAVNLVVVDIPEGVESIGRGAFWNCYSLTTVSFPTTLTWIGVEYFTGCFTLENIHLLHTKVKKLGQQAFYFCPELNSMTIPDSLQTLGSGVFGKRKKLVPSNINVNNNNAVVAYLSSQQE